MKVLVLSGPNLGRLGKRQPEVYGHQTLDDVHAALAVHAGAAVTIEGRQSNSEGELVGWVGEAGDECFDGVLFNPGAYTHTSYALYDAILSLDIPVIEVHISNPDAREEFRRESRVAPACAGRVAGFGTDSYLLALDGLLRLLSKKSG